MRSIVVAAILAGLGLSDARAEAWEFRLVPYVWAAGLSGDVRVGPNVPPAEVDLSFGDILENLDFAVFAAGEARQGDLFFRSDLSYASITGRAATPGAAFSRAELTARTFNVSLAAGYTVYRDAELSADVFAGARLWRVGNELVLKAGTRPGRSAERTETFVDPILGLSGAWQIAPDWQLAASAFAGGFGIGADLEYGGSVVAFWQAGETWGLAGGYRYIAVDYDEDGFVFDVRQNGPFVGAFVEF